MKAIIFDWGDTVMRDFPEKPGPMYTWDTVLWIPGMKNVLESLKNNYTLIIATNAGESDTDAMKRALRRIDAEKYFRYFYSSKDLGVEKPDKRFFINIATEVGIDPEDMMMVGNSYEKDIIGASIAGMKTVFFNEKRRFGDFIHADFIIYSMEDLSLVVSRL
ncbi:MAG: HAD-IA family hydrolase [Bacteroidales bacterium]|nr:HAD-IA family hydrolase [Bacteroidales bacterium]